MYTLLVFSLTIAEVAAPPKSGLDTEYEGLSEWALSIRAKFVATRKRAKNTDA